MQKVVSDKKKANMWRLLTLHPAGARVGVMGVDVGVGVRRGEGEVDGVRLRGDGVREGKRGDGVRTGRERRGQMAMERG
jgi:hypothetical protein